MRKALKRLSCRLGLHHWQPLSNPRFAGSFYSEARCLCLRCGKRSVVGRWFSKTLVQRWSAAAPVSVDDLMHEHRKKLFEAAENGQPVMFELVPGAFSVAEIKKLPPGSHAVVELESAIEYLPTHFFAHR